MTPRRRVIPCLDVDAAGWSRASTSRSSATPATRSSWPGVRRGGRRRADLPRHLRLPRGRATTMEIVSRDAPRRCSSR
jgi:hypothetical protein